MLKLKLSLALSTMILLAGCATSTPPELVRPILPPMAESCIGAKLPAAVRGLDLRIFALRNRATAILANRGVKNCRAFYEDVLREFGRQEKEQ